MELSRVELTLKSPAILNGYTTLESLLAAAVYERTGLQREAALAHVPIAKTGPIWQASAVFFEGFTGFSETTVIRRRRRSEMGPEYYEGAKRSSKNGRYFVEQGTGDFKCLFNVYPVLETTRLIWFALCDSDRCTDLLWSLQSIGKRRGQGYGEIADISVLPATGSAVVDRRGLVRRPIPVEHLSLVDGAAPTDHQTIRLEAVTHPYWESPKVVCAVPASHSLDSHDRASQLDILSDEEEFFA